MSAPPEPEPFAPFARLESRHVYRSSWCNLRRDVVDLGDGTAQEYHVFEVPDAAVVVPELEDGRIVLIAQYRYPHGRTHWEVPAGRIAPGESPADAARRELFEEAGCSGGELVARPRRPRRGCARRRPERARCRADSRAACRRARSGR